MGSRRFQSQDMDNYALKFPSGEKDFIFGNKKHYSINEGEINRFNMLKNPFEKEYLITCLPINYNIFIIVQQKQLVNIIPVTLLLMI